MKKPLKVLVHDSGRMYGGVERYLYLLLKYMDREMFEPTFLHEDAEELDKYLEEIDALGVPRVTGNYSLMSDLKKVPKLSIWLRKQQFDVVHINLDQRYVALAAWMAGVPASVWTCHVRIPSLKPYQHWMNRTALQLAGAKSIAVSNALKQDLVDHGYPEKDVMVIEYGLEPMGSPSSDFDRKAFREYLGVESNELMALTPARLTEQKGITYLLQAISEMKSKPEMPSVRFVVAGDGPLREDLEREAEELQVSDRIIFLGFRKDIAQLLWACDFLVLPSLWEGLPLVLIEALSAKVPCVVTDVDGSAEVIEDGKTGLVIPPRDPVALADAIQAISSNTDLRTELGLTGAQVFDERFHVKRNIERVQNLYLELYNRA